jgi:hypothetical protein
MGKVEEEHQQQQVDIMGFLSSLLLLSKFTSYMHQLQEVVIGSSDKSFGHGGIDRSHQI